MQQLLRSMKVDQRETSFHLELHFTSVGFGRWFSIKDSQEDLVRKLHEMADLIESDLQMRSAQLRNEAVGTVGESPPLNKHYPVEICPSCDGWCFINLDDATIVCPRCEGTGRVFPFEREES